LHIVHVSSGDVARQADRWRAQGVDVTVETCPHYLSLNEDDFNRLQGIAKCAPPLRSQEQVESLWTALVEGVIDIVASDHSPAPPAMKQGNNGDIFKVWGGISGAQTTLNVLLEEGYFRRGVPLERLVQVAAAAPARRFGLFPRKGIIAVGSDADLCLVDLAAVWQLEAKDLLYRHQQSPFLGKIFRGKVVRTLLRGQMVSPGRIQATPARMVRPQASGASVMGAQR
jgi:allantoinase